MEKKLNDIINNLFLEYQLKKIQTILDFYWVKIWDRVMAKFNIEDRWNPKKWIYRKDIIDEWIIIREDSEIKVKSVNKHKKWVEWFRVHRPKYHLSEWYYYCDLEDIESKI